MSELKFSSSEVKEWLENETSATLSPVQKQAQQLRDEMNKALQAEAEVSKMLLDNSAKEIERRNMRVYNRARALNKLARLFLDRLKKTNTPEQVTYDNLSKYAQDIQRVFIVADIDIKNWFPRISPFFIMDRRKFLTVHEKTRLTLGQLNEFVNQEYVKTKTLEETFQLTDELLSLENQLSELETQTASLRNERMPIEREIAGLEQKVAALKTEGPIDQLNLTAAEAETLNGEIKHALRHLQKPFVKMQALAFQGGGAGLTQEELKKLNEYLENPLEAVATEDKGCPVLKQILQKLDNLMKQEKIKLKSDKARKAGQSVEDILKRDSLVHVHERCADVVARRTQLMASAKMEEIKHDIAVFQDQIEQLKARKTSAEAHEAIKEHAETDTREKIQTVKHAIEKNVQASLGKKILVQ